MLEARRIAVVGASARPGSFGHRVVSEVTRSPSAPEVLLVNPRYDEVMGRPCLDSLDDIDGPVDLVLLGVGDHAVEEQVRSGRATGETAPPSSTAVSSSPPTRPRRRSATGWRPPRQKRAWPSAAGVAWGSSTSPAGSGPSATSNGTRCRRGPWPWSPTRVRSSRRCCGPAATSASPWWCRPGQELVTGHRLLRGLRPRPGGDPGDRAGDGDAPPARRAAGGPPPGGGAGRGRGGPDRRGVPGRSGHGGRPLGGPGRGRRCVGGAVRRLRRRPGPRPRRTGRHRGALRRGPPGGARPCRVAASPPSTTRAPSGPWWSTWPSGSTCPSPSIGDATRARLSELLDPGLSAENPLDVWGTGSVTPRASSPAA